MIVQFEIPDEVAAVIDGSEAELARMALVGLVAEGIRSGRISLAMGRRALGLSRDAMDGLLKARGILMEMSVGDVVRDSEVALSFAVKHAD